MRFALLFLSLAALCGAEEKLTDDMMINGDFSDWPSRVAEGVTTTSVGVPAGSMPTHWYGGPGVGATATYGTQPFPEGQQEVPGNPKWFFRVSWSVAPSADWPGETHHKNYFRGTFLEYFGLQDVRILAGKTAKLGFYARSSQEGLPIVPILWHSYGANVPPTGPVKGQDYELFEAAEKRGEVAVAQGTPNPAAICTLSAKWQRFEKYITLPNIDDKTVSTGHYTGVGFDIIQREKPDIDLALIELHEVKH